MTVSDSTICADILKKFDEVIRHGLGAAKVNAFATDPNKIQRDQSTYDLSSLEVQQFSRDIEADRSPPRPSCMCSIEQPLRWHSVSYVFDRNMKNNPEELCISLCVSSKSRESGMLPMRYAS